MTNLLQTLWKAFARILRAIGRWVIGVARRRGIPMLVGYMCGKVDDFRRRLKRTSHEGRKRWLRGRIARWVRAVGWLNRNAAEVDRYALDRFALLAGKIPEVAPGEKFRRAAA